MIKIRYVLLFTIITTGLFCILNLKFHAALDWVCKEDSITETSSAILYFIASILFIYINKKEGFRNIWYWGYFLLFFVIAGEEISWGQRIFGIETPEGLAGINVQKEINIHNLQGIHHPIRAVALVVIFGICYAIPVTDRLIKFFNNLYNKINMPVFPLGLIIIPTAAILYMVIPRVFFGDEIFNWDEMGEWYLSVGFFLFSLSLLKKKTKQQHNLNYES